MTNGPRGTVLLDLDGTLADSAPDLADSLDLLMAERGLAPFGLGGTRALIGHGIPALVAGALRERGLSPGEAEVAEAAQRFHTLYGPRLTARTRPYPGAEDALRALAGAGWRLVVCTNKRTAEARAILDGLGLLAAFDLVAGPDAVGARKPDPAHLLRALPAPPGPAHPAVMVGDTIVDVEAARAAHVPVIACAWGYAKGPVEALGADAVASSFAEVPVLVERLAPR